MESLLLLIKLCPVIVFIHISTLITFISSFFPLVVLDSFKITQLLNPPLSVENLTPAFLNGHKSEAKVAAATVDPTEYFSKMSASISSLSIWTILST